MKKLLFLIFSISSINILPVNVESEVNKRVRVEIFLKRLGCFYIKYRDVTFNEPHEYTASIGGYDSKIKFTIDGIHTISYPIEKGEDLTFYIKDDGVYVELYENRPLELIYSFPST